VIIPLKIARKMQTKWIKQGRKGVTSQGGSIQEEKKSSDIDTLSHEISVI